MNSVPLLDSKAKQSMAPRHGLPLLAIAAALALSACSSAKPDREDVPRATVSADWAQVPEDESWGEVSAVDVDSHGHVFVLQRGERRPQEPGTSDTIGHPVVYMFAKNGVLLDKWGAGEFTLPYGLSVDDEDNVWVTDIGSEQVIRFSHDGTREMTLGEPGVSGDDHTHFGRPTDIAFAPGKVFVSDGYSNSRIVVFDTEGHFLTEWGHEGAGDGGLAVPHSVAAKNGKVYVADRDNGRIKIFTEAGELLDIFDSPGLVSAAKPFGKGFLVSVEGRDAQDRPGAIVRVWWPDGKLERALDASGEGTTEATDLAMAEDGTIYLADRAGGRVITLELAQKVEDD